MPGRKITLALAIACVLLLSIKLPGLAAKGIPGSSEFGFGGQIHLAGINLTEALNTAGNLHLDWIAIDLAWNEYQPKPDQPPNLGLIDQVMQIASQQQLAVLVRLTNPPAWALTPKGPDSQRTAKWIVSLAQRYPGTLMAVEIYPGANTRAGWGAPVDPKSYYSLVSTVRNQLQAAKMPVIVVAGGLVPLGSSAAPGDMTDTAFLESFYQAAGKDQISVISLQINDPTGAPLAPSTNNEPRVLRRYEDLRQVMVKYQQGNNLLWITRLCPPSGKINPEDLKYTDASQQADWLTQAYSQIRSQLYIGVAIMGNINQPAANSPQFSLIQGTSSGYHPFYKSFRNQIAASRTFMSTPTGKSKNGIVIKKQVTANRP
ncbi:MAG TPA: hypothetical protein VIO61_13045 [Anaerolineaceae bacterium]